MGSMGCRRPRQVAASMAFLHPLHRRNNFRNRFYKRGQNGGGQIRIIKNHKSNGVGSKVPILLLANKQDLPSALDECKIEAALGLKKEFGTNFQWHLQPICAITGEGLDEGMEMMHSMIVQRRKLKKSTSGFIKFENGQVMPDEKTKSAPPKTSRKVQRSHSHHVLSRN